LYLIAFDNTFDNKPTGKYSVLGFNLPYQQCMLANAIYVLVTTTDNYLESLLTLTTLASSPECSTLTHINCLLPSFTLTFIVCIVYVAICQLF